MSEYDVLVVDDEQKICDALDRVFMLEDLSCLCLISANEALRRMQKGLLPKVIISDYRMPEMNGNEFLAKAANLVPSAKRIMLTGQADLGAVEKAINEIGLYRFMQKPWNDQDLIMTAKEAIALSLTEAANKKLQEQVERQLRELQVLDRLKDEFISNVSHELRTPINCLQLIFSNLADGIAGPYDDFSEKLRSYLGKAERQTVNLKMIIDDLLDIFKLNSDGCSLQIAECDLSSAVADEVGDMEMALTDKGLALVAQIEPGLCGKFDAARIKQVVRNLLSNAQKFTDAGTVTVSLRGDAGKIVCAVRDTGIGLRAEDCGVVFDRFRQVGEKTAGKPKGTGLGLAICKRIVELHGGSIRAESELGKGSVFIFEIPKGA